MHKARACAVITSSAAALVGSHRGFSRAQQRFSQGLRHSRASRVRVGGNGWQNGSSISASNPATGDSGATYASATPSSSPPRRVQAPGYLYQPFMGHSTRFAAMCPPLTRTDITQLEREPLSHVTPGRVNDHICIGMVKTLRWIADRAFRERYIHRATMLVTLTSAAPAAASVAAYLRMFFKRRPTSDTPTSVHKRTSIAAEVASPFLAFHSPTNAAPASSKHASPAPTSSVSGAALRHSYVDELRGLLAQSEGHAVHYQILSSMAEITAVERGLVLLLQGIHFTVYLGLFLFYPRMGFRLMAYTAEESSVVWTQMVNDIDLGKIAEMRVPQLALHYWGLEGFFTAQGALVPMLVPPKPQDVVVFHGEKEADKSVAAAAVEGSGDAASASAPAAVSSEAEGAKATEAAADPPARRQTVSASPTSAASAEWGGALTEPTARKKLSKARSAAEGVSVKHSGTEGGPSSTVHADPSASLLTLRDVVLLIRSDEMVFRDLNHEMANKLDTQPGWLRRLVESPHEK